MLTLPKRTYMRFYLRPFHYIHSITSILLPRTPKNTEKEFWEIRQIINFNWSQPFSSAVPVSRPVCRRLIFFCASRRWITPRWRRQSPTSRTSRRPGADPRRLSRFQFPLRSRSAATAGQRSRMPPPRSAKRRQRPSASFLRLHRRDQRRHPCRLVWLWARAAESMVDGGRSTEVRRQAAWYRWHGTVRRSCRSHHR